MTMDTREKEKKNTEGQQKTEENQTHVRNTEDAARSKKML